MMIMGPSLTKLSDAAFSGPVEFVLIERFTVGLERHKKHYNLFYGYPRSNGRSFAVTTAPT